MGSAEGDPSYSVHFSFVSDSVVEFTSSKFTDPSYIYEDHRPCFYTVTGRILTLKVTRQGTPVPAIGEYTWYLVRKEPSLLVFQANVGSPSTEQTMTLHKKL